MKLASLKRGGRDGALVVVSSDLRRAIKCMDIAPSLQKALDDWSTSAPKLSVLYKQLNGGTLEGEAFKLDPQALASPLPRAYAWLDGTTYTNHVQRVRKSRGQEMPENFKDEPMMYQGGSDGFLGPCDDMPFVHADNWGVDFEGEVSVITDDVPMGVTAENAAKHIKLIMLCNDISLRNLAPGEVAKGLGFVQCKPPSAFSPVAVTPEELGKYWDDGKLHLPLRCFLNGELFGEPNAGEGTAFNFAELIAHAARTRPLGAGTIIGSGAVSNKAPEVGFACIAEKRIVEQEKDGKITTPFLKSGDVVKIEMLDNYHNSVFGAIEQTARPYKRG